MIARIRAILRRSRNAQEEDDAILRVDDLSLNIDTHEVFLGDEEIDLSPTEFNLLHYLMLNANRVLSKGTDSRPRMGVRLQRRFLHCGVVHFVPAPQD